MTDSPALRADVPLPESFWSAMVRGMRGKCPRCAGAALFRKWLKPVDHCAHCRRDWSTHRADDFPAYISIFITGHVLAPFIIMMIADYDMSAWLVLAIMLPVASLMMLGMLQPAKGAVLAGMWWNGMLGQRERPVGHPDHPETR